MKWFLIQDTKDNIFCEDCRDLNGRDLVDLGGNILTKTQPCLAEDISTCTLRVFLGLNLL